ncbi:hypothetical protein [Bradyrhizobium sp. 62]|uniref:hypothetical protein n=1 Tax=Bradyrhizobium sp. 62 TaxID=1043588 RepID=UPI001FF9A7AA|nr:hypothetical protein [Bradyrhizobium sp. 62]MCK1363629.1 hypothetical protein [Bradyrhizobium sp. 62]
MNLGRRLVGRAAYSRFGFSYKSFLQPEHRKIAIGPSDEPTAPYEQHQPVARFTDRQLLGFFFGHSAQRGIANEVSNILQAQDARYPEPFAEAKPSIPPWNGAAFLASDKRLEFLFGDHETGPFALLFATVPTPRRALESWLSEPTLI